MSSWPILSSSERSAPLINPRRRKEQPVAHKKAPRAQQQRGQRVPTALPRTAAEKLIEGMKEKRRGREEM
jgi:hypothetical protein